MTPEIRAPYTIEVKVKIEVKLIEHGPCAVKGAINRIRMHLMDGVCWRISTIKVIWKPCILSAAEVKAIIEAQGNTKHRMMLSLVYACGLRSGELLNIKRGDIDSSRGIIFIQKGKGRKDRIVPLPKKLLAPVRDYYKAYRPKSFLFEGQKRGVRNLPKRLQSVIKQAVKKVGIRKKATLHWLRHGYATHLLEWPICWNPALISLIFRRC